jgi:hypothetical protein
VAIFDPIFLQFFVEIELTAYYCLVYFRGSDGFSPTHPGDIGTRAFHRANWFYTVIVHSSSLPIVLAYFGVASTLC